MNPHDLLVTVAQKNTRFVSWLDNTKKVKCILLFENTTVPFPTGNTAVLLLTVILTYVFHAGRSGLQVAELGGS